MKRSRLVLVALATSAVTAAMTRANGLYQTTLLVENPVTDLYGTSLTVSAGGTYNFEIVGELQPVTVNGVTGVPGAGTTNGANSLSYNITDTGISGSVAVQPENLALSTSPDNWANNTGYKAGTPVSTPSTGAVVTVARPIAAAGTFYGGNYQSLIETGQFYVDPNASNGASSSLSFTFAGTASTFKYYPGSSTVSMIGTNGSASDSHGYFGYLNSTLTVGTPSTSNPLISLTPNTGSSSVPTTYSSSVGLLNVQGSHAGGYTPAYISPAFSTATGYTEEKGIANGDAEFFALQLSNVTASGYTDSSIVSAINASNVGVTATTIAGSAFANTFSGYDILLTATANAESSVQFLGFDLSAAFPGVDVTDIAAVPEPTSLGLLALGGIALMRRRRVNRKRMGN